MHKYLIRESELYQTEINYILLNPDIYAVAVGDIETIPDYLTGNFFIVDHATMSQGLPVDMRGSRGFLLIPLLNDIENATSKIKIYEDENVSVYLFDNDE
jgi:hypothetical protein